jgi:hypothetical protein
LTEVALASHSHLSWETVVTRSYETHCPRLSFLGRGQSCMPYQKGQWSILEGKRQLGVPVFLLFWEEFQTNKNKTQTQVVGGKEDLLC